MVYLDTPEEWQRQSAMLLQARPTTARVTSRYKIPNLGSPKYQNGETKKRKRDEAVEQKDNAGLKVPKATFILKTFDPVSGVVLKFKTDRAADVGRLIAGIGRLGRLMAALPEEAEDVVKEDAAPVDDAKETTLTSNAAPPPSTTEAKPQSQQASAAGGSNKKKKKGKK